jgi:hypothetical protein
VFSKIKYSSFLLVGLSASKIFCSILTKALLTETKYVIG